MIRRPPRSTPLSLHDALPIWTERVANGEIPATAPKRPQGIERNVVITIWDWADPKAYLHDLVSTDRNNPTVDRKSTRLNSSHANISYAVFCLKKKNTDLLLCH